jgi:hypothetical protein
MADGPRFFRLPEPGDIVWCLFPERGIPKPGPKPRPAIVLRTGEADGRPMVQVAYGTSRKLDRLFGGEFAIGPEDGEAFVLSGLSYPTKFDLGRAIELPFNEVWFEVAPGAPFGQTPRMGVLHPSLMTRAKTAHEAVRRRGARR